MKIDIANQQKIKKINLLALRLLVKKILLALDLLTAKVSLLLCDNDIIIGLNRKYFKKSLPTDVIAFPLSEDRGNDYFGEVVVSVQQAVIQAKELGNDWKQELLLYIIHGILHLTGYDDSTKAKQEAMFKKQEQLLNQILAKNKKLDF